MYYHVPFTTIEHRSGPDRIIERICSDIKMGTASLVRWGVVMSSGTHLSPKSKSASFSRKGVSEYVV